MSENNIFSFLGMVAMFAILGVLVCLVVKTAEVGARDATSRPVEKIEVETVDIEGCHYLKNRTANGYCVYTHKGNCSNDIHSRQLKAEFTGAGLHIEGR